jgi:hypothetical protein
LEGEARFNKERLRLREREREGEWEGEREKERSKIEKSLDIWELGPFIIAVAEVVQVSKGVEVKNASFRPLGLII